MASMSLLSRVSLIPILGLALCAGVAQAQPAGEPAAAAQPAQPAQPGKGRSVEAPKGRPGAMAMRDQAYWERRLKAQRHRLEGLGLTDEQKQQIDGLPARQAAWYVENGPRLDDLREQIRKAQAANDAATLTKLGAERQVLIEQRPTLESILTDQQRLRMYQQSRKQAKAAAKAGNPGQAKQARSESPEVKAIRKQMDEALAAGDMDRVKALQAELHAARRAGRANADAKGSAKGAQKQEQKAAAGSQSSAKGAQPDDD